MSQDRSIRVAPDSTGARVRNLEITVLEYDPVSGTSQPVTMDMQVISIADKSGKVLNFDGIEGQLERLNDQLEDLIFEVRLQNETSEE